MNNRVLIKFGDKIVALLVLLWAAYSLFLSMGSWKGELPIQNKADQAIDRAKKASPSPSVSESQVAIAKAISESKKWAFAVDKNGRQSLFNRRDKVDTNVEQAKYDALLQNHGECQMIVVESGGKACAFPGCKQSEKEPDVYIGVPTELKQDEVNVMTVKISWKGVASFRDAAVTHCLLQRKVPAVDAEKWEYIMDEEGNPLKIFGMSLDGISEGDVGDDVSIPSGFQLPGVGDASSETEGEADSSADKMFSYFDYNLEPSTEYVYRVKAMGLSTRDETVVEGMDWTAPLSIETKEDQGLTFSRFIPGLRNKKGELLKKKDGSFVSPDKVYVKISNLFTPPWSPVRYFVSYEHKNILPGLEGKNRLGKEERYFPVLTEDGTPVYIDGRKENFLYVSEERSAEEVKTIKESGEVKWKPYKIRKDFTTEWLAVKVEEEVVEEIVVHTKFNAFGKKEKTETPVKKYRYFLTIKNEKNQVENRLELERDDHSARLMRY